MNKVSLGYLKNQILLALIDGEELNTFHFQLAASFGVHDMFFLYLSHQYARRSEHLYLSVDYIPVRKYPLKCELLLLSFVEFQLFPLLFSVLSTVHPE